MKEEERTPLSQASATLASSIKEWSNALELCSISAGALWSTKGYIVFLPSSPLPLHYNSQNALPGGQTDALPLPKRRGEAFPIAAVSYLRLNVWEF